MFAPEAKPASPESAPRPEPGNSLFTDAEWKRLADSLNFTERELQIVQAVAEDLKDNAIAARLGISLRTVRTHFERLYRKLGITRRTALLIAVVRASRDSEQSRQ